VKNAGALQRCSTTNLSVTAAPTGTAAGLTARIQGGAATTAKSRKASSTEALNVSEPDPKEIEMDSTVVVAIAGLVGTGSGAVLSYKAGLASSREETERLREQHREDERRNRQGTYHQLIALVNEMVWADQSTINPLLERWFFLSAGISLFAAPAVVEKTRLLSNVLADGSKEQNEEWRERVLAAGRAVVAAMREDIGVSPLPTSQT
jgi:hypothetical protein